MNNLALLYLQLRQPEKALETLNTLKQRFPEESVNSNLGLVLGDLGRREEALQAFTDAIEESDEERPGPYWNRARLLEKMGRRREALLDYQAVLRVDPTYREAQLAIELMIENS